MGFFGQLRWQMVPWPALCCQTTLEGQCFMACAVVLPSSVAPAQFSGPGIALVAKVLLGSYPRRVPAIAVGCGLHLVYAQPFPWSWTEAEASSLSVYSLGLAGLSQTLKRNEKQIILKVLFLKADVLLTSSAEKRWLWFHPVELRL